MKIVGYARVSTRGQATNGNSLEEQQRALQDAGCSIIYKDAFTGTKTDRPELNKAIMSLENGDTLIVTKLDRIARSLTQGSELVSQLIEKGVKVHILNIGVMDNTPASKLIKNIFFSFAEFERDMIIERTQEGKSIAKTKTGFKEGRPKKFTDTQIKMALDLLKEHSYTEVEMMTKISKATLVRAMRKRRCRRPVLPHQVLQDSGKVYE